jgi:hypothetical protein
MEIMVYFDGYLVVFRGEINSIKLNLFPPDELQLLISFNILLFYIGCG